MTKPRALALLGARMVLPFSHPASALRAIASVPWFVSSLLQYVRRTDEPVSLIDLYPCLTDRHDQAGRFDAHYFYQDIWAATKVHDSGCTEHVDVGSRVDGFVAHCATFTHVAFVDIRPLELGLRNVRSVQGTVLELPFASGTVPSISSLHVVEHVGLGRYGDPLQAHGSEAAMAELARVLAPEGDLYFSVPVGRERVCFNAHRVFRPRTVLQAFSELELVSFAAVDDDGRFMSEAEPADYEAAQYACGLFHFRRPRTPRATNAVP